MKPSPVVSILLFCGTVLLVFSLFGRGWDTFDSDTLTAKQGPLWGEICVKTLREPPEMDCKTHTFLSDLDKGMGVERVFGLLFVVSGLAGIVIAGIAGFSLLNNPRSSLSAGQIGGLVSSFMGGGR